MLPGIGPATRPTAVAAAPDRAAHSAAVGREVHERHPAVGLRDPVLQDRPRSRDLRSRPPARTSASAAGASSTRWQLAQRPQRRDHDRARAAEPDGPRDRRVPRDRGRERPAGSISRANRRVAAATSSAGGVIAQLAARRAHRPRRCPTGSARHRQHRAAVPVRRVAGQRGTRAARAPPEPPRPSGSAARHSSSGSRLRDAAHAPQSRVACSAYSRNTRSSSRRCRCRGGARPRPEAPRPPAGRADQRSQSVASAAPPPSRRPRPRLRSSANASGPST